MGAVITCSLGFGFGGSAAGAAAPGAAPAAVAAGAAGAAAGSWATAGSPCPMSPPAGMRLILTASSPSLISISAMPDSSSSSISFLIFRMSMPGMPPSVSRYGPRRSGCAGEPLECRPQRQLIAERPQAGDYPHGNVREIRVPAKALAGVDVGKVNLDERQGHRQNRIAERDAGMREAAGVEDHEVDPVVLALLNALDQLVLGIALEGDQLVTGLMQLRRGALFYRLEGVLPVDGRLPGTKQIEIRAVEQQHSGHGRVGSLI